MARGEGRSLQRDVQVGSCRLWRGTLDRRAETLGG